MVVVAVDVIKETPRVFTQRIIDGEERLASATAMGFRLLPHESDPAVIHLLLPPGGLGENAREVRFVGAVEDAAVDIGHTLVGQHDESRQIVLKCRN
jgi:hypothetical protein